VKILELPLQARCFSNFRLQQPERGDFRHVWIRIFQHLTETFFELRAIRRGLGQSVYRCRAYPRIGIAANFSNKLIAVNGRLPET